MEKETASKPLETCEEKGCVKLFGVIISDQNQHQSTQNSHGTANLKPAAEGNVPVNTDLRLSKVKFHSKKRKAADARGVNVKRWTEFEHQKFLKGLKFCGKGDWKGISKYFVPTRTPKQVASHAQKYFLAQASSYRRNYRSSIFDMPLKQPVRVPEPESAQRCPETSNTQPLSFVPKLNHLRTAYVLVPTTFGKLSTKAPITAGPLVRYPFTIVRAARCCRQVPDLQPENSIETA